MSIEEQLVSEIKLIVARGDIHGLQKVWKEYVYETDFGRELAWDFIFQKIYSNYLSIIVSNFNFNVC